MLQLSEMCYGENSAEAEALVEFYKVFGREVPAEDYVIRENFLQASSFVGREAELKQLTDSSYLCGDFDTQGNYSGQLIYASLCTQDKHG